MQQHFQQPLDITINEKERVFFQVSGSHAIYLTGNYLLDESGSESDGDYNMPEDFGLASDDEIEYDNESDELDELEDPRITELHSDAEEETPQLVAPNGKKRRASDSEDGLDEIIAQSMKPETNGEVPNGEAKLSKKQRKKLKLQGGSASVDSKPAENGSKKVQFAKNLEQGPTPKKSETLEEEKPTKKEETGGTEKQKKPEAVKQKPKAKAEKEILEPADSKDAGGRKSSVKTVKGVIIDDRVSGEGSRAKKGSKVQLRFIEKLADGKVVEGRSSSSVHDEANDMQPTRRASPRTSKSALAKSSKAGISVSKESCVVANVGSQSQPTWHMTTRQRPKSQKDPTFRRTRK